MDFILATAGTEVNIGGGVVENGFIAESGSEVNITGGRVRSSIEIHSGSLVNMRGGNIIFGAIPEITGFGGFVEGVLNMSGGLATNLEASPGSEVNISGGNVAGSMSALAGSMVNISGGNFQTGFRAESGSMINITGGNLGPEFVANEGSEVTISGGTFNSFKAGDDSVVNLVGANFMLDGVAIDLGEGEAIPISERNDSILSGFLADGTEFDFELSTSLSDLAADGFSSSALLTVTLADGFEPPVPELTIDDICTAVANGIADQGFDTNGDGLVNSDDVSFSIQAADSLSGDLDLDSTVTFADFLTLSDNFGSTNAIHSMGDITCDGEVAFADFLVLSSAFGQRFSGAAAVPEPNAGLLLLAAATLLATQRRRR